MPPSRSLSLKSRPRALKAFTLQPTFTAMERHVWEESLPRVVWYGLPVEQEYTHAGGAYLRCHVEAFDSQKNSLGFLPLPHRYRDHWVQLCYTIVHTRCEWDAWAAAKPSDRKIRGFDRSLIQYAANQNCARLLHYLTVRRQIVEELLSHTMAGNGVDHLEVFDEFVIRDAKGWLWKEYKELSPDDRGWMEADPAHPQNAQHFDWRLQSHLAPHLLPPQADSSWIHGEIVHYNFKKSWNKRLKQVVTFYRSKALRSELGESTFHPGTALYPDAWHEGHAPAIQFLTEEQMALAFHRSQRPARLLYLQWFRRLQTPEPRPSRTANLRLDCPEARVILEAFADRSRALEIPPTIAALQQLFGDRFDPSFWSQVLDSLVFHEDESARMTIEQAWGLVIAAQRTAMLPSGVQQGAAGGHDSQETGRNSESEGRGLVSRPRAPTSHEGGGHTSQANSGPNSESGGVHRGSSARALTVEPGSRGHASQWTVQRAAGEGGVKDSHSGVLALNLEPGNGGHSLQADAPGSQPEAADRGASMQAFMSLEQGML